MFVDEKAEGEPYLPEKPDELPSRYPLSICLSLLVALFCYDSWLDNVMIAETAKAELWSNMGSLAIALALGIGLVAWVHSWFMRTVKFGPPF